MSLQPAAQQVQGIGHGRPALVGREDRHRLCWRMDAFKHPSTDGGCTLKTVIDTASFRLIV